jgi:hypothetical protein
MKTLVLLVIAMIATGTLGGCGSSSTPATAVDNPPPAPAKITGLSTPKSVSVVTAD